MTRREEILKRLSTIPALPALHVRLLAELEDPGAEPSDLARRIQGDPGLTANILRVANSAAWGAERSIRSVKEALLRLGPQRIRRAVLAWSVGPLTQGEVRGYDLSPGRLWEHSLAVASGTEVVAELLGLSELPEGFTAGLLHDVGKIVMGTFVSADGDAVAREAARAGIPFPEAEQRVLGIDHAEVGAALLEQWKLPPSIVEAIRWHHEPDRHPGTSPALDVLHLADMHSLMLGLGAGADGLAYRAHAPVGLRWKISPRVSEQIAHRMALAFAQALELFGQAAGRPS